jgi:tetratricopeptide (TPR) repeat protein
MKSRLMISLDLEAQSSQDPIAWARAVCRSAAQFARQGKSDDALKSIAGVRKAFGKQLVPEVASWLMLAEGILNFFLMRWPEAYDRVRRAYAIAVAMPASASRASCAAWMAHIEFNEGRYEEMVKHVGEAFARVSADDHHARARASLVLADAFHFAGRPDMARRWYEQTRISATTEGDEATLSALLHNVAAFRASEVRLQDAFENTVSAESHRAQLEASSALNYDLAVGTESFNLLIPTMQGQLLMIEKKYAEALRLLQSINETGLPSRLVPILYADIAWSLLQLGELDEAWIIAKRALELRESVSDPDDMAYLLSRCADIAHAAGQSDESARQKQTALAALGRHREIQTELLASLTALELNMTSTARDEAG